MRKAAFIFFVALAALMGCRRVDVSEGFQEDETLRMEIKGYTTFRYDPLTCQLAFNREQCEFRVHTDNMSDFYIVRFDEMPAGESQVVGGTITWTTGDDLHSKKTDFSVLKIEGSKVWLWSAASRIAVVVQILE